MKHNKKLEGRINFWLSSPSHQSAVNYLLLIFPLLLFFWNIWLCFSYINDDAFISFRYAKNFLVGQGLVFNPGEYVEGYTNFLWVMVCSVLIRFAGAANILVAAKILAIALSVGTIVITFLSAQLLYRYRLPVLIAVLLLASNMGYAANSVSGLETSLFTFWITLAFFSRLIQSCQIGDRMFVLSMVGASLTRPEGFFLFIILTGIHLGNRIALQRIVRCCFYFSLGTIPYLLWKVAYYGSLLPNTYYAKPGTIQGGLYYSYRFLTEGGYTKYWGLPLIILLGGLVERRTYRYWYIGFLGGGILMVICSGGDWMLGWRFCMPFLPILFLIMGQAYDNVLQRFRFGVTFPVRSLLVLIGIAGLVSCHALALSTSNKKIITECDLRGKGQMEAHFVIAHLLKNLGTKHDSVALTDIGMIGYYSGLRILDISGLTDPYIGHSPGKMLHKQYDTDYILDQSPPIFCYGVSQNYLAG